MADVKSVSAGGEKPAGKPAVVTPTTKVNVAFPFATIRVQEPSQPLAELSRLVADLAAVLAGVATGPEPEELRVRAKELAARLA